MNEFRMPSLGADMESGIVVEWLVEPGDSVKRGDVVVLVETEKGIIDVEIWQDAVIDAIVVPAGGAVPVGTVIAMLQGGEGALRTPVQRKRISPRARAVAAELGVDVTSVAAAGTGTITEDTVRAATASADQAHADPAHGMRRAIGRAMTRSKQEIPHYYVRTDVDVTETLDWLTSRNAAAAIDQRILPAALLCKSTALAARDTAAMNGHYVNGDFIPAEKVNLGVAISLRGGGLVAPAIHDCAARPLDDVMANLADLVKRARSGHLRHSEVSTATITISNLGDRGVDQGYGVIVPPQVAIVCFGRLGARPWVVDGSITARSLLTASLSADHRVSDGHEGGNFLQTIARYLHKPGQL